MTEYYASKMHAVDYAVLPKIQTPPGGRRTVLKMLFTKEMIAPCGLDCSLCMFAHAKEKPCLGCNVDSESKPAFCASWCKIIPCEKRVKNGYEFCDECPDYPCEDMMERETRYTTAYPLKESPMQNLKDIRTMGMEAFLEQQRKRFTCAKCGGPICIHNGICRDCGSKCAPEDAGPKAP